jgi:hypothetical protein
VIESGFDAVAGHVAAQEALYLRASHSTGALDQRRVELLREPVAQLAGHVCGGAPAAGGLLDLSLTPAVLAVGSAPVRQRLAAAAAARRERSLSRRPARLSVEQPLVQGGAMVGARQRRARRHP